MGLRAEPSIPCIVVYILRNTFLVCETKVNILEMLSRRLKLAWKVKETIQCFQYQCISNVNLEKLLYTIVVPGKPALTKHLGLSGHDNVALAMEIRYRNLPPLIYGSGFSPEAVTL